MLLTLLLQQRNSNDVTITAFVIRCDNVWNFRYIYVHVFSFILARHCDVFFIMSQLRCLFVECSNVVLMTLE